MGVNEKERRKPKILKKKNPTDVYGYSGPKEATVVHTGYIWLKLPFTLGLWGRRGSVMCCVI